MSLAFTDSKQGTCATVHTPYSGGVASSAKKTSPGFGLMPTEGSRALSSPSLWLTLSNAAQRSAIETMFEVEALYADEISLTYIFVDRLDEAVAVSSALQYSYT